MKLGKSEASIGRIVIVHSADPDSVDGKPLLHSPAIIQHVYEDGSVRLFVFGSRRITREDRLIEGAEPGQWSWPELK